MGVYSICGIFAHEEHLNGFLKAFEHGTWPKADWNHDAHLTVAGCYLLSIRWRLPPTACAWASGTTTTASARATRIKAVYHETLTVFWMAIVKAALAQLPLKTPRLGAVRTVVEELGPRRDLFKDYYGFDVVKSVEARRAWVEPDLKALP